MAESQTQEERVSQPIRQYAVNPIKTSRISPRNKRPAPSTKAGFRTYAFASRLLTELKVNCQNLSAIQLGLADWMGVEICMQVFSCVQRDRSLAREGSTSATTSNFVRYSSTYNTLYSRVMNLQSRD